MTDLQLQKDEVVVDMMEMKEKEELVMEEVPEGQLVVAEPELLESNNKGGVDPHHQPSGIVDLFSFCTNIQGGFFNCSHPKISKCQPISKLRPILRTVLTLKKK